MLFVTAGAQHRGVKSLAGYISSFQSTCKCRFHKCMLLHDQTMLLKMEVKPFGNNSVQQSGCFFFLSWMRDIRWKKKKKTKALLNCAHPCYDHKPQLLLGKKARTSFSTTWPMAGGRDILGRLFRTPSNCLFEPQKHQKIFRTHSKSSQQMGFVFIMEENTKIFSGLKLHITHTYYYY